MTNDVDSKQGVGMKRSCPKAMLAVLLLAIMALLSGGLALNYFDSSLVSRPTEPRVDAAECWSSSAIAKELDSWPMLSREECILVLQAAADSEAERLLLPFRPTVSTGPMEPGILGQYVGSYSIVINEDFPQDDDSGWLCLRALLHEIYHCFQHGVIDGLYDSDHKPDCYPADMQTIDDWRREFSDYQHNPKDYWTQEVEISARSYSKEAAMRIQSEAQEEGYQCAYPAISNKVLI